MDGFYSPIHNIPEEQKKAFDDQLKALQQQHETIRYLIMSTEKQAKVIKGLLRLTEQQGKIVRGLLNETEKQGKRSGIQGVLSLTFSIVALLIAGLAVWFSFRDFKSDEVWQQEQIGVLEEIRQSINP